MKKLDVPQSGSQAGTTASRNRYGQYNRTRAMPTQPRSAAQVQVRAWLAAVSQAWGSLTDAQRAAWNAFATAHPITDSLGQTIALTGHAMFVSRNVTMLQAGYAIQNAVPDGTSIDAPDVNVGTGTAAGLSLRVTVAVPVDTTIVAYASPPLSAGRAFNGDFRVVNVAVGTNAANQVILTADQLTTKYGTLSAGQKYFVQAVLVKEGNISAPGVLSLVLT